MEDYSATWLPYTSANTATSSYWPTRYSSHHHTYVYNTDTIRYSNSDLIMADHIANLPLKETPEVSDKQSQIDEEVKAALEKPRREAEVQRRVELAAAIGATDKHEVGTVLRWTRKHGDKDYFYVAIKGSNDKWYVSGQVHVNRSGYTWDELVEWMITGVTTVENVEVATAWDGLL
ncbi:MAG TPA: hypothetical protein VIY48_03915 [Candidatus Paceibacterota bacterium]